MKKFILILTLVMALSSCWLQKEDSKITFDFLSGSYIKEYNTLDLSAEELTNIPNFEKYLTKNIKAKAKWEKA